MSIKKMRSLLCLALATLILLLSACGSNDNKEEKKEVLLPISVNDKEIRVGETTVQTLLDEGLEVSWVNENFDLITIDPSTQLEADSYYTGSSIKVSDKMSFSISMATGNEAVTLGQAVIGRLEVNLALEDDKSVLEKISFDGVPVTKLTREKAGEKYPDWSGNEAMWLQYGQEYKYTLTFDLATGTLSGFTVERTYDVDWNS